MKVYLSILCLILFVFPLKAQKTFKVIKVKGTIILLSKKAPLTKGAVFKENDKLDFKTNNAYAYVIKKGEGRYILKKQSDEILYAKANLSPAIGNMPKRNLGFHLASLDEVKQHFNKRLFIKDTLIYSYSDRNVFFNKEDYLIIKYNFKGKEVRKRLKCLNNCIQIIRNDLFEGLENNELVYAKLFYADSYLNSEKQISSFTFNLTNMQEVEEEITMIIQEMEGAENKLLIETIMGYINDVYGKIDPINTRRLIEKYK